ncbi:DUF7563 family protein [Natronolimnohabitans innermongolicus]
MQRWDRDVETRNPRRCQNCGAHVSSEFRRIHGDDRGLAHRCPQCEEYHSLPRTAAGLDAKRRFGGPE